jgi:hypothetical protein
MPGKRSVTENVKEEDEPLLRNEEEQEKEVRDK